MGPSPDKAGKRRGPASLVAAGAFGLFVVVMLVWLLATSASPPTLRHSANQQVPRTRSSTTPPTTTVPTTVPLPAAASASAVENQAPTDVKWQLYQGVALPFSATNGPSVVNGDVATGYAHNPEGALLAATQIGVRYLLGPDWQAVTATSVAPGPGRDAYAALRQSQAPTGEAAMSATAPTPGTYLQLAGYQFVTYTPQTAVVQLISQAPSGTNQVVTNTVTWSGGDWKLVLQANGSSSPTAQTVSSLAGFIVWGGVS
jgi:hypothetical protein